MLGLPHLPPLFRDRGLPHQLIVTTGFDTEVERSFAEAGEELDVVFYIAGGRDRGAASPHAAPDGSAVVVEEPNAYAGLSLDVRTVLLKIHGQSTGLPHAQASPSARTTTSTTSRAAAAATVPVTLAARLRRSHLLFLGYTVHDWSLRVFLATSGVTTACLPLLGGASGRRRRRPASYGASETSTSTT